MANITIKRRRADNIHGRQSIDKVPSVPLPPRGMAEIEIGPLHDRLSDDEVADLAKKLDKKGYGKLPAGDEKSLAIQGETVDGPALTDLIDRLDAYDAAAEIYVPLEFDGQIEVGDLRIGSLPALIDALEELTEDLEEEKDEDDESEGDDEEEEEEAAEAEAEAEEDDDYGYGGRRSAAKTLKVLKTVDTVARLALEKKLPLHIRI